MSESWSGLPSIDVGNWTFPSSISYIDLVLASIRMSVFDVVRLFASNAGILTSSSPMLFNDSLDMGYSYDGGVDTAIGCRNPSFQCIFGVLLAGLIFTGTDLDRNQSFRR